MLGKSYLYQQTRVGPWDVPRKKVISGYSLNPENVPLRFKFYGDVRGTYFWDWSGFARTEKVIKKVPRSFHRQERS